MCARCSSVLSVSCMYRWAPGWRSRSRSCHTAPRTQCRNRRSGDPLTGDKHLAEGAVGEQAESFLRAVHGDACLDVDAELPTRDGLEQARELLRGRGGHDAGKGHVVATELL